jgi:hypothetical protein
MPASVATCAPAALSWVAAKHLPFFRTSKKLHDRLNQPARPGSGPFPGRGPAARLRADFGRSQGHDGTTGFDPDMTFMTSPVGGRIG